MNIKKIFSILIIASSQLCANPVTSKTFFSIRPEFQTGSPEREVFWRDPFLLGTEKGSFELVPFVGHSADSKKLAQELMNIVDHL